MQILMNKPVYLRTSILELSKLSMYEFQYDYVNSKHGEKVKLCYLNLEIFIVYIKTDNIYRDIAEVVETNYELDSPLSKVKSKKVIVLMKDELGGISW